ELDRDELDLMSPGAAVLDALRTADLFPPGHPDREAAQRRAARLVAADPSLLDEPAVAPARRQLRRWARLVPHLLDDEVEFTSTPLQRAAVSSQLARLAGLEDDPATSQDTVDAALRGLDQVDPAERLAADRRAHFLTARRLPATGPALVQLAGLHVADDRRRGIGDWRTRWAIANGTQVATLRTLQVALDGAVGLSAGWWRARARLMGEQWSDRRALPPHPPAALEDQAAAAAHSLAAAMPDLAAAAMTEAGRMRAGRDNRVTAEADGRPSATVVHRPTDRGALMVAHELGHAVHAVMAMGTEPPGALVGETVACWASLVAGRAAVARAMASGDRAATVAAAMALGDMLVEEVFVSAAISSFEDRLYGAVAQAAPPPDALGQWWADAHEAVFGGAVSLPDYARTGWARLPSLAQRPGHALAYTWASLLALAAAPPVHPPALPDHTRMIGAMRLGGVDADEMTVALGFQSNTWIAAGLGALAGELTRLAQILACG
ncbi:MAG: hypothetical protein KDB17_14685, partial [Ilumatobacter sp.]|nr:hypothetical protein [Ilumatobacter sp.]